MKEQHKENNKIKSKGDMRLAKCGVLVALVAVLGAETAFGKDRLSYWDPDSQSERFVNAERITKYTGTLAGGWYYVEGYVDLDHSLVVCKKDGFLICCLKSS